MNHSQWHELVCIICLSIATALLMTGYDTQSSIVESILYSVHMREPKQIDKHAGYYGQSVLYGFYTVSNLFAPWVCYRVGSKWTLFLGSLMFTTYQAGFFMLNSHYYYASQALMGIGFALYYSGQGLYMSEHSTKSTITRNSTMISAIANCSMLVGGVILFIIFYIKQKSNGGDVKGDGDKPNYRDVEEFESVDKTKLQTQISNLLDTAWEPRMFFLTAFFAFYGFHISFLLGAYPATFAFSRLLSSNVYLPAYYNFMVGLGDVLGGFYIAFFDTRFSNFGLIPTMVTEIVLSVVMYILTSVSTANLSTIQANDDTSMWITPSVPICCFLGLLHGMIDCCSSTMRALICTIAIPRKRLQAYSLAKLYQSAASCLAYFLSPHLTVRAWMVALTGIQIFSAAGFVIVAKQITREGILKQQKCLEKLNQPSESS
ncbi:unnamed protein product [Cylicocyclus nassatus]|uniref:Uncharacterized protein n=1 Tax=Cylicocyclus nassatus TaxID=53992 RepID=A0AA36H1S4_CYLNA|nr:unnamed protein product [Cylicocyclus nassatus]